DRGFAELLQVANLLRRRNAELLHHRVAEPRRKRRLPGILLPQRLDARGELADRAQRLLTAARALAGDVRARQIEQVGQVLVHLALEAPHRAIGPRWIVLIRAQVVQDEEFELLLLRPDEAEAARDLVEHARADLAVPVEVHFPVGREGPRGHLADV